MLQSALTPESSYAVYANREPIRRGLLWHEHQEKFRWCDRLEEHHQCPQRCATSAAVRHAKASLFRKGVHKGVRRGVSSNIYF